MAEELGTKDVLEQVDRRLVNMEHESRAMRSEIGDRFDRMHREIGGLRSGIDVRLDRVHREFGGLRSEMDSRFDVVRADIVSQGRWLVGLFLGSWLTIVASIWLKT